MKIKLFIVLFFLSAILFSFEIEFDDNKKLEEVKKYINIKKGNTTDRYLSTDTVTISEIFFKKEENKTEELTEKEKEFYNANRADSSADLEITYVRRIPYYPPFDIGEKLEFKINYGVINAGSAILEVRDYVDYKNHECFYIFAEGQTNDFFSAIHKVHDWSISYIDTEKLISRYFSKHQREGSYKKDVEINFFQDLYYCEYNNGRKFITPPYVQDILSAFYYVRTMDLVPGKSVYVEVHTSRKNVPLEVKVHNRETIEVDAGTFKTIKIEPVMRGDGLFRQKGNLHIWLTDDEKKMPVMVKSEVMLKVAGSKMNVGSIRVELTNYHGVY